MVNAIYQGKNLLGWRPKLTLSDAFKFSVDWYEAYYKRKNMRRFSENQINSYEKI